MSGMAPRNFGALETSRDRLSFEAKSSRSLRFTDSRDAHWIRANRHETDHSSARKFVMNIPSRLAEAFPPSATALLDFTRRQIDDVMLLQIAEADYGQDADKHLAALRKIRDEGCLDSIRSWHPHEVIELSRLGDLDQPRRDSEPADLARHRIRAFCCAAFLTAELSQHCCLFPASDLARLILSTKVLGPEAETAAGAWLTWAIPRCDFWEDWLFNCALVVLACRTGDDALVSESLEVLREAESELFEGPAYLDSLSGVERPLWRPLAKEIEEYSDRHPNWPTRAGLDNVLATLQTAF
jgi:hypothetical protein